MKTHEVSAWVALLNVSLLASCGGTSSIGSGAGGETSVALGGAKTGGSAGTSVDATGGSDTGAAGDGQAAAGMPGAGGASNMCQTATDCGAPPPNCLPCTDGSCATYDCVGKHCALTCLKSSLACEAMDDCRALGDGPCTKCLNDK